MEGQTVTVGSQDTIDVIMTSSTELVVIVTGYGTSSREKFTGAVAVKKRKLLKCSQQPLFKVHFKEQHWFQVVSNDGVLVQEFQSEFVE